MSFTTTTATAGQSAVILRLGVRQTGRWVVRESIVVFLILAAAYATLRGPYHKDAGLWDYAVIYSAAHAWRTGGDPYNQDQLVASWRAMTQEAPSWLERDVSWLPSVVPPTTVLVHAPFTLFPPVAGGVLFVTFMYGSVLAVIVAAVEMLHLRWSDPRAWLLAACVLACGPVHIGLNAGQPAVPCAGFLALGLWASQRRRPVLAGVLLAIATAFKLQLGAPFIVFFLWRRNWRVFATALGAFAGIGLLAVLWMNLHGVPWLSHWMGNIRLSAQDGNVNDFSSGNLSRTHLVNLQLLLAAFVGNRSAVMLLAPAIVALVSVPLLISAWGRLDADGRVLALSATSALILLPIYHRFYDALILALPLAWCLKHATANDRWRSTAWAGLALLSPFLLPVAWVTQLMEKGIVGPGIANSAWWEMLVVPHLVWALAGLAGVLVWATWQSRRSGSAADEAEEIEQTPFETEPEEPARRWAA